MSNDLDRNQHSAYILHYHLVLVIKYRRKVIIGNVPKLLVEIFKNIGKSYGIILEEFNWEEDHIHFLFRAKPQTELVKFINSYKSASSRIVKKQFSEIKYLLWNNKFWKTGYFLSTTGGANIDVIKKYIENQRRK